VIRRTLGRGAESSITSPGIVETSLPFEIWSDELRSRMESCRSRLLEKGDELSIYLSLFLHSFPDSARVGAPGDLEYPRRLIFEIAMRFLAITVILFRPRRACPPVCAKVPYSMASTVRLQFVLSLRTIEEDIDKGFRSSFPGRRIADSMTG